jgi:hypothetical protein
MIWPAMSEAFGRICSEATKNPSITNTPAARAHLKKHFDKGLSHLPALQIAAALPKQVQ